jgi:DNA-binding MarR family transcriptional regulator
MKIFLSHCSRDKALVREFRDQLPRFLDTWLDEDRLAWGESIPADLKATIQSATDFLIIFLDKEALSSAWVKQELAWAMEREKELKRTFVLPILLEAIAPENLPSGFSERLYLRLADFGRASVEALANGATVHLFRLVAESFASVQLAMPQRESLRTLRDGLSAGQARLLGYLVNRCKDGRELTQREIEHAMGYSSASSELFYRLESLIAEGFLQKRRIAADGQFSYRLTRDCAEIGEV